MKQLLIILFYYEQKIISYVETSATSEFESHIHGKKVFHFQMDNLPGFPKRKDKNVLYPFYLPY